MTSSSHLEAWTIANVVRIHARARGRRPMITDGQRTISYAEMDDRSSRVARALAAEGVATQDRVAFLDKNGPEYFEVLFGGGKINAVNVAVNWRLAPAEMKYTIDDAEAKVLFVGPDFFPHLAELEGNLRTVKKIVALGEHPRHEGYAGWVGRQLPEDTGLTSAPDDVAMQLYTSGTTRLPKGKTGDAGFADAEGYLFLTDRVKDMIVSGGENVYPAEVENALSGHPDIADVAVIGVPHEKWGETVKAIVVRRSGADPAAEALIDYARQRLARYKCPTSVDFLDALPRNPSGKLLKRQLREPYWKGYERRIH